MRQREELFVVDQEEKRREDEERLEAEQTESEKLTTQKIVALLMPGNVERLRRSSH